MSPLPLPVYLSASLPPPLPPSLSPCNRSSVIPSYACVQLHACPQSVSLCNICSVRPSMSVFMHVSLYLSVPSFCPSVYFQCRSKRNKQQQQQNETKITTTKQNNTTTNNNKNLSFIGIALCCINMVLTMCGKTRYWR